MGDKGTEGARAATESPGAICEEHGGDGEGRGGTGKQRPEEGIATTGFPGAFGMFRLPEGSVRATEAGLGELTPPESVPGVPSCSQ